MSTALTKTEPTRLQKIKTGATDLWGWVVPFLFAFVLDWLPEYLQSQLEAPVIDWLNKIPTGVIGCVVLLIFWAVQKYKNGKLEQDVAALEAEKVSRTPTQSIRVFPWLKRSLPQVNSNGIVTIPFQVWNISPRKWKVESLSFVSVNAGGKFHASEVRSPQNQAVTLEPYQTERSELSITISGIEGSGQIWLEFVGGSFRATSDTGDSETVPMNPHVPVFVLVEKV